MKTYIHKIKNKRVILAFSDENSLFYLQFRRLKFENEIIEETGENSIFITEIFKDKIVVTTIVLSKEVGWMLFLNFYKFLYDVENGLYCNFYNFNI